MRSALSLIVVASLSRKVLLAFIVSASFALLLSGCTSAEESAPEPSRISGAGTAVGLQYIITLEDGTEVASNVGGAPLEFTVGRDEIFPALEAALEGLVVGDRRTVSLGVDEAYGVRDEKALREVSVDLVPEESRVLGAILLADDDEGGQREVTVVEIDEKTAILDLNHPLAGEALSISVLVLDVDAPESGG